MQFKPDIHFYSLVKKLFNFFSSSTHYALKLKVKGGALYIAILISIIIGIILSLFILIANYNQRHVTVFAQSSQLYFNLQSAFELAQSDYFTTEKNNAWQKNTFNDDSTKIKKIYWGAYLLITADTKNRHQSLSQSGLYGTYMPSDTGLLVSDNGKALGVSGTVSFKANCYIPAAGIKPASIEGQNYINAPQNTSFTKTSPSTIPLIETTILQGLKKQQEAASYSDSIISELPQTLSQSFRAKTIVCKLSSGRILNMNLKNNIKLIAVNIEVDNTCNLENILIICEKIKFKEGFKGKVHVIASDSIITEKQCEFNYPSSFVLLSKEGNNNSLNYINLNEDNKFYGGILAINENNTNTKVFVKLNAKSEVNGFIYSSNYLHLEGNANATIIADKLLIKTPSAVYENHLLGCEIDPKKYSDILAIPMIFKKSGKLLCCGNMN